MTGLQPWRSINAQKTKRAPQHNLPSQSQMDPLGLNPETVCLLMMAVYGFFGITLAIAPAFFFGPDSIVAYWTFTPDTSGTFFGKALGIWMTAITTSPWVCGVDKGSLAKVYMIWNIFSLPLFIQCAMRDDTGPGANALLPVNLWMPQVLLGAGFIVFNYLAIKGLPKGGAMF